MEIDSVTYSEGIQKNPDYTTTIKTGQEFFEFKVKAQAVNSLLSVGKIKDFLFSEGIRNLIKKSRFLQLYIQLVEEQITEAEYENELNKNPDDYFIDLKEMKSDVDYAALLLVMQNLPEKLSLDDVSEIFGIEMRSLANQLNERV